MTAPMPEQRTEPPLKPCPFCGEEAKCSHGYTRQDEKPVCRIFCENERCPAYSPLSMYSDIAAIRKSPWGAAFQEAVAVWNRRAAEEAQRKGGGGV